MKKGYFYGIFLIFLFLIVAQPNFAQVTIGVDEAPVDGALLQLKDKKGVIGNGDTAAKGLGMPRVILTKLKPTTPAEFAKSIGNATESWNLSDHIGLFVYNTKEDICAIDPIFKGLYTWNGTQWEGVGPEGDGSLSSGVYEVIDARDKNVYLARNFGTVAGDWMLANLRYVPKAVDGYTDYVHSAADAPDSPPNIIFILSSLRPLTTPLSTLRQHGEQERKMGYSTIGQQQRIMKIHL